MPLFPFGRDFVPAFPFKEIRQWYICGRGRCYEYLASDAEIASILQEYLLPEYGPYRVVRIQERLRIGKRTVGVVLDDRPIESVADMFVDRKEHYERFYIYSKTLAPGLDIQPTPDFNTYCCYHGALRITQSPRSQSGLIGSSHMSLVEWAGNEFTGGVRHNQIAFKLYNRIKRQIRKQMKYQSIRMRPETGEEFLQPWLPMTEGVAELARGENNPYEYRPGPPLDHDRTQ